MKKSLLLLAALYFSLSFLNGEAAFAQWNTNTKMNNAICSQPLNQQDARIVSDGDGGAIMAWVDNSTGTGDISAQRIDKNGIVKWTMNGISVCNSLGDQAAVNLTEADSGSVILSWTDRRIGNDADIYAQKIDANGNKKWATTGAIVTFAAGTQQNPKVLYDGVGGAFVVFEDSIGTASDWNITAQHLNNTGTALWTPNGVTVCNAAAAQINPRIETDGSTGAYIVWQDKRGGTYYDVYAQLLNVNGVPQWAANGVAVCNATNGQLNPKIEPDGVGGAIIAWVDKRSNVYDVYAQRINNLGVAQWTANGVGVCTATGNQSAVEIKSIGTNGAVVAWKDARTSTDKVYAQRVDLSGNMMWAANGNYVKTGINPNLCSDYKGGVILTYQDSVAGSWNVYANRLDASGNNIWGGTVVVADTNKGQTSPKNIGDGHGGGIFCWQDNRRNNLDIYAMHIDSNAVALGVAALKAENKKLQLYPNPCGESLVIGQLSLVNANTIHIYDVMGREVVMLSVVEASKNIAIDVSKLANGTYFIKAVSREGNTITNKFIVQHNSK